MKKVLLFLLLIIIFATPAYADIVWPSLYIACGMLSIKVIIAGLLIELLFVKFFAHINWIKASVTTFIMNSITCVLGMILIPVSGIFIELISPFSTFHWSHWLLSYLSVILINTSIEGLVVKISLKQNFKSVFWWLFMANVLSVLVCILFHGITMQGIKL